MPIPSFEEYMLPVLKTLAGSKQALKRHEIYDRAAALVPISKEDKEEKYEHSGRLKWTSIVSFAITHLKAAKFLEQEPSRAGIRITEYGRDFHSKKFKSVTIQLLKEHSDAYAEWSQRRKKRSMENLVVQKELPGENYMNESPPESRLETAYKDLLEQLQSDLLEQVRKIPPARFERLTLDLLVEMGYGSPDTVRVIGGRYDGGIDGILQEDKLGLAKIYVQAKRYKENNRVPKGEVLKFIGALSDKQMGKGVFITASDFTRDAKKLTQEPRQQEIAWINGDKLVDFMIKHNIGIFDGGVSYPVKKIDLNYFEDE